MTNTESKPPATRYPLPAPLEVRDLTVAYREKPVLWDVDVQMPAGQLCAIVGPNGAGKTNILEAVSLLSPGRGLRRATNDELARQPERLGWRVQVTHAPAPQLSLTAAGAH